MEYVDGEDLRSLLRRIGRLPGSKAIEIARKLCAGLAAAHDKGVLLRDLKPANIMIGGRGQVLITDFWSGRARRTTRRIQPARRHRVAKLPHRVRGWHFYENLLFGFPHGFAAEIRL